MENATQILWGIVDREIGIENITVNDKGIPVINLGGKRG